MSGQALRTIHLTPGTPVPDAPLDSGTDVAANYDGRLFVAPTDAYQWVLAKVRQWEDRQRGEVLQQRVQQAALYKSPPAEQVLRLVGERGIGKTWLLKHLAQEDGETAPASAYLDLEKRYDFQGSQDFVAAAQARFDHQCENGACLLLLDSVPLRMDAHLRALEDMVLRPHLSQRGSMVIMALGHPSRDCWRLPALRGGESRWLQPFSQAQTRAQLAQLDGAGLARYRTTATALQDYSGGLPLLNYLLARWRREQAYDHLLEHVLSRIPFDRRGLVRSYLDAVCVLEVLEHEPVEKVLRLYHRFQRGGTGTPAHAGQVRNVLRRHWLARSAPGIPGRIILVESVRRAGEVLKARDPELFVLLNEAAYGAAGGGQ